MSEEKHSLKASLETIFDIRAREPTESDYRAGLSSSNGTHERFFIQIPQRTEQITINNIVKSVYSFRDYRFIVHALKNYENTLRFVTSKEEKLEVRITRIPFSREKDELLVSTKYT